MNFFNRLNNGWKVGMSSLQVIKENQSLLIFPILSSISLLLILASFAGGIAAAIGFEGTDFDSWFIQLGINEAVVYPLIFAFYLVSYFIVIFFNVGLIHCARLIFDGETPSVKDGLNYSSTRVGSILSWALLAATVGVILKIVEDRFGWLGSILASIIGMVWSIASFFVVPIIAYENVTPFQALKRSAEIMKAKWGETIGANFSFGLFYLIGYLVIILLTIGIVSIQPIIGIATGIVLFLLLHITISSAKTVFLAATYNHMNNQPPRGFDGDTLDELFIQKR